MTETEQKIAIEVLKALLEGVKSQTRPIPPAPTTPEASYYKVLRQNLIADLHDIINNALTTLQPPKTYTPIICCQRCGYTGPPGIVNATDNWFCTNCNSDNFTIIQGVCQHTSRRSTIGDTDPHQQCNDCGAKL